MSDDGVLFAVDPYPTGRLRFSPQRVIALREVARVRRGRVEWLRMKGKDAAAHCSNIDFLFIDGEHSYDGLRGDWEAWSGLVTRGGIVALHDSHSSAERDLEGVGSVTYTQEVILSDPRFELVEVVDTLTVLRCLTTAR
jgi:predicted O-methyltransferase YrrM